jgi:reactive intermediate/imine deaminase
MTMKHGIATTLAPPPLPQFSQGVRKGSLLQTAGQVGTDPATGESAGDDVETQTRHALHNVNAIIEAGGGTFDDVVSLRVYLKNEADFAAMNSAYDAFVPAHSPSGVLPARTTVVVGFAAPWILVEIDALAVLAE